MIVSKDIAWFDSSTSLLPGDKTPALGFASELVPAPGPDVRQLICPFAGQGPWWASRPASTRRAIRGVALWHQSAGLPLTKGLSALGVRMSLGTSKYRAAPRICSAGFGKPDRRL